MPEGPEIRRAADDIAAALVGKRIVARFAFPRLQAFEPLLHLRQVTSVTARGKAMLIGFEPVGGRVLTIYSHNQLYGEWQIVSREDYGLLLKTGCSRQVRLALFAEERAALLYSASEIEVLQGEALESHPYLARLGLELLDPAIDASTVRAHLDAPRFARKNIAALLLDQRFFAGVGNYLRSEILFGARIPPHLALGDLNDGQRQALATTALDMTRQSYRTGGITIAPELASQLKARGWSYRRYRHWVFDRDGQDCHRCGDSIVRAVWAGRSLFLCRHCQR